MEDTKANRICAWDKCCKFLRSIGLRCDDFLEGSSRWQRQLVLVAFTQAVRQADFLQVPNKGLVAATVRYTIG